MTRLRLILLGAPRLERDGQSVEMDTRKATAMLAYLALTGKSHTREALANLFWPDYDPSSARAALRRTLSVLRKGVGEDVLETDWDTIRLLPEASLWVDALVFNQLIKQGLEQGQPDLQALEQAEQIYGGDFMAGFSLRDSPDFNDWQFFEAEGYRRRLIRALETLVQCRAAAGDFPRAIHYARRWLSLDSLHEEAHRQLMRLYAWTGERNAALRQYRESTRILDEELGVAPMEETSDLYAAILENRLPRPPAAKTDPLSSRGDENRQTGGQEPATAVRSETGPPLIGREPERLLLSDIYTRQAKQGFFFGLVGEAGIGKTTLAENFLAERRDEGAVVLTGRCYEGEDQLAYSPIIEALRGGLAVQDALARVRDLPSHWLLDAARLVPELAPNGRDEPLLALSEGAGAQSRFFESLRQVINRMVSTVQPGILFLDDIQWADSASLELLTYLVRRMRGSPLLILATWRDDELPGVHPLRKLVYEVQRAGTGLVRTLPRFNQAEVAGLVHSSLGEQTLPAGLVDRLLQETEGLPFFVVEYLKSAAQEGAAADQSAWMIPHTVRDLLHNRLERVGGAGAQLLSTAAVIGRSFDFETLREASGRSEMETLTGLEELLDQGLVAEQPETTPGGGVSYNFTYDPLRKLVYEETSLTRRRLLHRRVGDAVLSLSHRQREPGPLAAQVARHFAAAGQEHQAAELYARAGEEAQRVYANAEALAHFRSALALGHPHTGLIHESLGDLLTLSGEYQAALTSYQTAAAHADEAELARLEHRLGQVYGRRGDWELAVEHYRGALAGYERAQDAGQQAWLLADWARAEYQRGEHDRAMDLAHQALELAERSGTDRALAQVLNTLGILSRSRKEWQEAAGYLRRSLQIARQLNDLSFQVAAMNNLALVYGERGDEAEAVALVSDALELCTRQGDRHREAALLNHLADLYHNTGQPELAMEHLTRAVQIFAEIGRDTDQLQAEVWKLTEW